ncbi:hypothetical protein [Nesterenkonia xinjiangensis]|uniref:Uncharacterized protein n=1 Tax=Nesterenkonia xinjiangensis TaxID=225327 RepID=A0A7Z0K9X1_9MICC|nr:hypothetical protein [Nesterenkonia xinjiangensis]NYJ79176.1 hypothetical protein [Nesterenkonia xinjiangensis]
MTTITIDQHVNPTSTRYTVRAEDGTRIGSYVQAHGAHDVQGIYPANPIDPDGEPCDLRGLGRGCIEAIAYLCDCAGVTGYRIQEMPGLVEVSDDLRASILAAVEDAGGMEQITVSQMFRAANDLGVGAHVFAAVLPLSELTGRVSGSR